MPVAVEISLRFKFKSPDHDAMSRMEISIFIFNIHSPRRLIPL